MQKITINRFDGGMTSDLREPASNRASIIQHFDIFTNPHRLTPFRSAVSGNANAATNKIANFLYANGILYGLGVVDATSVGGPANEPCLFTKTDLTNSTWTADSHSTSPVGAIISTGSRADADTAAFGFYPTTGKIYGVRDGRYIWSVLPATSTNPSEADLTSYTFVSNFLHHSKDDCFYLGYDNKIARNNNGTWTVVALTLPSNYVVTSLTEYGNYLAIACRPKNRGRSKVYLWNRDSSLSTISEVIDWGDGELYMLEELNGHLIGVSFSYVTPGTNLDNQFMQKSRVAFRYYSGAQGPIQFDEFIGAGSLQSSFALSKQKANNRLYFPATIVKGSSTYQGIWSIGRSSTTDTFRVTCDRLLNNGTTVSALYGFSLVGDYTFFGYATSNVFGMDKTDSAVSYTATSVYESVINPGIVGSLTEHRQFKKQIQVAALSTSPLTTGQQAILKYRVDGGAWVTILTASTVGTIVSEATVDASGKAFGAGREIEFRVESTGGAEPTALTYGYNIHKTLL